MISNGLLKGKVILDCSILLPGPLLGKLFALKGARVIKIENPARPDGAKGMGHAYSDLNQLKEVVYLDLTSPGDRVQFRDLVKNAAGLIEGFRPQAKRKLGLDEKSLHQINPKLCIASLIGYPENGPWADRAGHDLNFAAITGCASLFHEMPALPLADLFSAYYGAFSLMAALDAADRGLPGSRVVISMSETLLEIQSTLIHEYKMSGTVPRPGETLFSGKFPCYRIYQCGDGKRISVGAIEPKFWNRVCEILQTPQFTNEGLAEGSRGAEVTSSIQKIFLSQPLSYWIAKIKDADCCVEPILDYSEVNFS